MIIITNTIQVKKGFGENLIERFSRPGNVEKKDGFVQLNILQTQNKKDYDEIVIETTWESKKIKTLGCTVKNLTINIVEKNQIISFLQKLLFMM